jgi:hypothetical protein
MFDESFDLVVVGSGGGYLDRFEEREGEWKIAQRTVLGDFAYAEKSSMFNSLLEAYPRPGRRENDPWALLRDERLSREGWVCFPRVEHRRSSSGIPKSPWSCCRSRASRTSRPFPPCSTL